MATRSHTRDPAFTGQYSAIMLGATGNVGGRIVQLLIKNPLCKQVVVVTRRKTDAFADPKVSEVVVNMDRLEEEVAPHAQGVDVASAAFGVGKGSAKMPEEEVRKIEIAYALGSRLTLSRRDRPPRPESAGCRYPHLRRRGQPFHFVAAYELVYPRDLQRLGAAAGKLRHLQRSLLFGDLTHSRDRSSHGAW